MTARPGPGGRIAPDNRGPQAGGVGRQSARTDLERRDVPFLHGSDLQQGDVEAMRNGQRIAPVTTQQPATPNPQTGSVPVSRPKGGGDAPNSMTELLTSQLGGTAKGRPQVRPPDPQLARRGRAWLQFLQNVARQPGASPMFRAAVQTQVRRAIQANETGPIGGALFMRDGDVGLEALGNDGP